MKTESELRDEAANRYYAAYAEWREIIIALARNEAQKISAQAETIPGHE